MGSHAGAWEPENTGSAIPQEQRNKRVYLHVIPTSSSWLNLVERFFGVLTDKQLRRGVFTSADELEQTIIEFCLFDCC